MRLRHFASLLALATVVAASATPARAAWPHDPVLTLPVAPSPNSQNWPNMASDGAGGFFFVWQQQGGSTGWDIYAQHLDRQGARVAGWPVGGVALYAGGNDQTNPVVLADGAGGAFFAWEDRRATPTQRDIYVARLDASGNVPSGWIAGGIATQSDLKDEYLPVLVRDGAGGFFVVWTYVYGTGDTDIYGSHFLANGTKAWTNTLIGPLGNQYAPSVVEDGSGGFIFSYTDESSGTRDVRASRFYSFGSAAFSVDISAIPSDQYGAVAASDGEGGAIIAYFDDLPGPYIFARRIMSNGSFAPGWVIAAVLVSAAINPKYELTIIPDGAHGAIIGWLDSRFLSPADVFAIRLGPYGDIVPGWTWSGTQVCVASSLKSGPVMAPDGSGGATMAWFDTRNGNYNVYASRLTGSGALAPGWISNGTQIRSATGMNGKPVIAWDGTSAVGIAWRDDRNPAFQIYAQRVERFGVLGNPEPAIARVRDVIRDQGGKVSVVWNSGWLDADPLYGVASYWLWRQVPMGVAQAAVARGAEWTDATSPGAGIGPRGPRVGADGVPLAAHGLYMNALAGPTDFAWEFIASQPATGFPTYSYVASTTTDSMPSGNPRTAFLVQARGIDGSTYWSSTPDSGYSVDNLAPVAPAPFTGVYHGSATALHWAPNTEVDLAGYNLYRGSSAAFVPGPSNRIASPPDTGYTDAAGTPSYYKLSAVDLHGNESPFALLTPSGTADAPGAAPRELALGPISPNPARGPLTLHFSLPQPGNVTLAIFDASGRRVRGLVRGWQAAGDYAVPWDGRDESGRAAANGLYFVRLELPGRALNARFVRVR